jgi:hypothetical protein
VTRFSPEFNEAERGVASDSPSLEKRYRDTLSAHCRRKSIDRQEAAKSLRPMVNRGHTPYMPLFRD